MYRVISSSFDTVRVSRKWLALPAVLAIALAGCGRSDVKVYRVSKDTPESAPMSGAANAGSPMANAAGQTAPPALTCTAPTGWEPADLGQMRVASFHVKGQGSEIADVSVIPLGGMGGGDLENVNRWRGQVGLPPVKSEELAALAEKVDIGGTPGQMFDQAGVNPAEGDKTRILAAILRRDDVAWFFKMTGPDALVAQQKLAFIEFLKSVRFQAMTEQTALPPSHPPIDLLTPQTAAAGNSSAKPNWTVPAGWKEEPPSQMLIAKYVASDGSAQAEITVSAFPGDVGGLLANVNRWRGQVGLAPITDADLPKAVSDLEAQGAKASVVDLDGTDPKTGQKTRLVGVIVPQAAQTWFYKLMGDEKVVARERDALLGFVKSVK